MVRESIMQRPRNKIVCLNTKFFFHDLQIPPLENKNNTIHTFLPDRKSLSLI